jgi:hypothetical protein
LDAIAAGVSLGALTTGAFTPRHFPPSIVRSARESCPADSGVENAAGQDATQTSRVDRARADRAAHRPRADTVVTADGATTESIMVVHAQCPRKCRSNLATVNYPLLETSWRPQFSEREIRSSMSVKLGSVRADTRCAICWGTLKKVKVVSPCLHRFCQGCIEEHLRKL